MDFSAPFIQGLPVLGNDIARTLGGKPSAAWAKASINHVRVFAQPSYYDRFLVEHFDSAVALINHRGYLGSFEYFEAFPTLAGKLGTVPLVGKPTQKLFGQTFGRFEASFGFFGDASRIYMWEAMEPWAKATVGRKYAVKEFGKPWGKLSEEQRAGLLTKHAGEVEDALYELGTSLNLMTGVLDSTALGIGWTQRQIESAFVFFAPRYTRAGLGLVSNMLRGGLTGKLARNSIACFLAGGTLAFVGAAKALGMSWEEIAHRLNPITAKSKFMSLRVGNRNVGFGGIFYALIRLQADLLSTAFGDEPINLIKFWSKDARWKNPVIKFLFNRTSPLTSAGVLMGIEHGTYMGYPLESFGDYAQFTGSLFIPIWIEETLGLEPGERGILASRDNWWAKLLGTGAELAGLRTNPVAAWELFNDMADECAYANYDRSWKNLMPSEQRALLEKYPDLMALKIMKQEDAARWDDNGYLAWEAERDAQTEIHA
jgi:hypothetical protein